MSEVDDFKESLIRDKIAGAEKVLAVAREVDDMEAIMLMEERIKAFRKMLPRHDLRIVEP